MLLPALVCYPPSFQYDHPFITRRIAAVRRIKKDELEALIDELNTLWKEEHNNLKLRANDKNSE